MTTASTWLRLRATTVALLLALSVLPVFPALATAAEATDGATIGAVGQELGAIPGIKGQVHKLAITTDPQGDANPGGDAVWAATGQVTLNKKFRNWLKKIVNSRTGWGQLPSQGTEVWATFVGLDQKLTLKGPTSVVVHQGYSDGSGIARLGEGASPFELDQGIDSFGIWHRDGSGFYPQAGSSEVTDASVAWFTGQFAGAGGVAKDMIANVIPITDQFFGGGGAGGGGGPGGGGPGGGGPGGGGPGGGGPGGGGNGGGDGDGGDGDADAAGDDDGGDGSPELPLIEGLAPSMHIVVESRDPDDPTSVKRDTIVWYTGTNRLRRDYRPIANVGSCIETVSTVTPGGRIVVEMSLHVAAPVDPAILTENVIVQAFGHDGEFLGEYTGEWTGYERVGMMRGFFELPLLPADVRSVRVKPTSDPAAALRLTPDGERPNADTIVARILYDNATNEVGVPGIDGIPECGNLVSDDVDVCDQRFVDLVVRDAEAAAADVTIEADRTLAPDGSPRCEISIDGQTNVIIGASGVPMAEQDLDNVIGTLDCPVATAKDPHLARLALCEGFNVLLWAGPANQAGGDGGGESGEPLYVGWSYLARTTPPAIPATSPDGGITDDDQDEDGDQDENDEDGDGLYLGPIFEIDPSVFEAPEDRELDFDLSGVGTPFAQTLIDTFEAVNSKATWRPAFPPESSSA